MVSRAVGARFGTVTAMSCSADSPSGSLAVTVTVEIPWVIAVRETTLPDTDAETAVASEFATE